jgi:hypothetical protein
LGGSSDLVVFDGARMKAAIPVIYMLLLWQ